MSRRPASDNPELQALEFDEALGLVRGFARTGAAREALGRLSPWDGSAPKRRLHQMELSELWTAEPGRLPVQPIDEALLELLNPGGWLEPEHWRQLREGLTA